MEINTLIVFQFSGQCEIFHEIIPYYRGTGK